MPIHLIFNGNKALDIIEGQAPYGISTSERLTKTILRRYKPIVCKPNPINTALKYNTVYQSLPTKSMTSVAKEFNVSRVRIHQMLNLLNLDKRIIKYLNHTADTREINFWTERKLRSLLKFKGNEQYTKFESLLQNQHDSSSGPNSGR